MWRRFFQTLAIEADNEYVLINSTIVKNHQHSVGTKKSPSNARQLGAAVAA